MSDSEAYDVLKILLQADGGNCRSCAGELFRLFVARFPQLLSLALVAWRQEYEEDFQ